MHNYVYHRNKLPVIFSTYFEENKVGLIHKYNTRQKDMTLCDEVRHCEKKYKIQGYHYGMIYQLNLKK